MRKFITLMVCPIALALAVAFRPTVFTQAQESPSPGKKLVGLTNQWRKDAFNYKDLNARRTAFAGFAAIANEISGTVTSLTGGLRDPDDEIRVSAAKALAHFGPAARYAAHDLVEMLEKDKLPEARMYAASALGAILWEGSNPVYAKEAVPALIKAMRTDEDTLVRRSACRALRATGPCAKEAAPHLLLVMKGTDDAVLRQLASRALYEVISPDSLEVIPKLIEMIKTGFKDEDVETSVWVTLGKIDDKQGVAFPFMLETLKKSPRVEVRASAAYVLARSGPKAKAAVPDILAALELINADKREKTRARLQRTVLNALGAIGTDARMAIPAVEALASSDQTDREVRAVAKNVLQTIQPKPR